jgi:hypothetical protein
MATPRLSEEFAASSEGCDVNATSHWVDAIQLLSLALAR